MIVSTNEFEPDSTLVSCVESMGVGYRQEDSSGHGMISHTWFSPYFRKVGFIDAPVCTWQLDNGKVTQTFKDTGYCRGKRIVGAKRIWILTNQYDKDGYRLGIWPD